MRLHENQGFNKHDRLRCFTEDQHSNNWRIIIEYNKFIRKKEIKELTKIKKNKIT